MAMSKIIYYTVLSSLLLYLGFALSEYGLIGDRLNKNVALKECIEEISNKCSSTISYAILLESENARLNRVIKNKCGR